MDAVTHVLLAHGAALVACWLWRKSGAGALAAAAGAAALAPDLDVLLSPLSLIDGWHALQHRGATHSIVGAPIIGFLFVALLARLSGRFERLAIFRWRRGFTAAILWGAWSHLLLDMVTRQGIVPLWPVSEARWSLEWFFYMIWWLAPISFFAMLQRYRGIWSQRRYLQAVVVVVAVLVVVGGVRLAGRPEGEQVTATRSVFAWDVATTHDNGSVQVERVRSGDVLDAAWYHADVPPGGELAVVAVLESTAYRAFRMDGTGPFVVRAAAAGDGWNVTVIDAVGRFQLRDVPGFVPDAWLEEAGRLRATVTSDGVHVHSRW